MNKMNNFTSIILKESSRTYLIKFWKEWHLTTSCLKLMMIMIGKRSENCGNKADNQKILINWNGIFSFQPFGRKFIIDDLYRFGWCGVINNWTLLWSLFSVYIAQLQYCTVDLHQLMMSHQLIFCLF